MPLFLFLRSKNFVLVRLFIFHLENNWQFVKTGIDRGIVSLDPKQEEGERG